MKKITTPLLTIAIFFSMAMTVCATNCTTKRDVVPASGDLPAYHTMVSGKTCNHSSRVVGTISTTCLLDANGNLTYHRLVRSCECNELPDVVGNQNFRNILVNLKGVGQPCQKEWDDVYEYHPIYK